MEPKRAGSKFMIRSSRADLADTSTGPYLVVDYSGNRPGTPITQVWNDKGSGAVYSVAIYRVDPQEGYYIFGDYAQGDYDPLSVTLPVISVVNDDPYDPLLVPPTGYLMMWSTTGTDSDAAGSIWQPEAPTGYVALGWVAQAGLSTPSVSNYMCVREDFLQITQDAPVFIWDDRRSGAEKSIALYGPDYSNEYAPVSFIGQSNYNSFDGTIYYFNDRVQILPY
ncbi:Vps62-related protein [uncultured Chitinophaga sp.]|jgi:Plant protein of unknown function (DUF946).|uniref:Vps62-related protein n=1 Tax=uncultured Chitinophaga sp. TaxID=339340 RepID=UPI002615AC15|nr:Vps62-related protein [uncultured Chitinophaga sp.]